MMNNNNNNNMNAYLNSRFGMDMTIIKTSIYKKHWINIDPETGEVRGEGDRYLTLVACVPTVEFSVIVDLLGKTNRPNTHGVFVATIGSTEGLIVTNSRVGLRTYQNHLESLGWEWVQVVPKCKGKSWEWVQQKAWEVIKQSMKNTNIRAKKNRMLEIVDNLVQLTDGDKEVLQELKNLNEEIVNI